MDIEKLKAWSGLLEKIAGMVALLCLTAVLVVGIQHFTAEQIITLLQDGRATAIIAVGFLSAITLIVMLLNANLKSTLQKILLVLVGALAGLLGQPSIVPYADEDPAETSQTVRHVYRGPSSVGASTWVLPK